MKSQKTLYIRAASDIEDVAQELFADSFIGVYWTFPAVGRKELADGIGRAVLASYTIRRQREAILEVADQLGLKCRAECALQFQPQFGWDERIQRSFHEAMAMADPMTAVISVEFQDGGRWRPNNVLNQRLNSEPFWQVRILPFADAIEHFSLNRYWDQQRSSQRRRRRGPETGSDKVQAPRQRLEQFHRYMRMRIIDIDEWDEWSLKKKADALHARGLWTITGLRWTSELVRDLEQAIGHRSRRT